MPASALPGPDVSIAACQGLELVPVLHGHLIWLVTRPCVAPDGFGYDNSVPERKKVGWKAVSYGAGAFAGLVTQRLLEAAWKGLHDASSPPSPADRRASWTEALSWAVATGVGMGVTRLLAIRTAAVVWETATHELPPEPALAA